MKFDNGNSGFSSNNDSGSIKMSIDPAMGMALITKYLYQSPIQTLTQEYISNARDAIKLVGGTNKDIQITLPTKVEPVLKIRDFGPGMSLDKIENVFAKLGRSDKRNDSSQTGGYGIGGKSAFAYTDSFQIRSIVDGEESIYLSYFVPNEEARIDIIQKNKTSEKNGTEVMIPVKIEHIQDFISAVYRTIYWWNEKPQILGMFQEEINKDFTTTPEPFIELDNLKIYKQSSVWNKFQDRGRFRFILLIDEIPYCLDLSKFREFSKKESFFSIKNCNLNSNLLFIFKIDQKTIEQNQLSLNTLIPPSREDIYTTELVQTFIEKICLESEVKIGKYWSDQFSHFNSIQDMDTKISNCNHYFGKFFSKDHTMPLFKNIQLNYYQSNKSFMFVNKETNLSIKFSSPYSKKNKVFYKDFEKINYIEGSEFYFNEYEEPENKFSAKAKFLIKNSKKTILIYRNVPEDLVEDFKKFEFFKNLTTLEVPKKQIKRKEKTEVDEPKEKVKMTIVPILKISQSYNIVSERFGFETDKIKNYKFFKISKDNFYSREIENWFLDYEKKYNIKSLRYRTFREDFVFFKSLNFIFVDENANLSKLDFIEFKSSTDFMNEISKIDLKIIKSFYKYKNKPSIKLDLIKIHKELKKRSDLSEKSKKIIESIELIDSIKNEYNLNQSSDILNFFEHMDNSLKKEIEPYIEAKKRINKIIPMIDYISIPYYGESGFFKELFSILEEKND